MTILSRIRLGQPTNHLPIDLLNYGILALLWVWLQSIWLQLWFHLKWSPTIVIRVTLKHEIDYNCNCNLLHCCRMPFQSHSYSHEVPVCHEREGSGETSHQICSEPVPWRHSCSRVQVTCIMIAESLFEWSLFIEMQGTLTEPSRRTKQSTCAGDFLSLLKNLIKNWHTDRTNSPPPGTPIHG